MNISFDMLIIETFDDNLSGSLKAKLKFKKVQTITNKKDFRLGDSLRDFVIDKIKKGTLPYSEEKNIMYAMVTDAVEGEVSCLIKAESIQ